MAGSNIVHIGGIRIRVVGTGNLRPTMLGYNDVLTETLVPLVMSATNFKEQTRICNFISQATKLKLETTEIDEVMRVNHIWVYAKEIYKTYPE